MRSPTGNRITQGSHGTSKAVDYSASPDPDIYAPEDLTFDSYMQRGSGTSDAGLALRARGAHGLHQFAHTERTYFTGGAVKKGARIARMGYTGYTIPDNVPAGTHLHWWIQTPNGYVYPPSLITEPFGGSQGGSEMAASAEIVTNIYRAVLQREPDAGGLQTYTGRPVDSVFNAIYNSPEANAVRQREQAEDARRNELEGLVRDLQAKIDALGQAAGAEKKKLSAEIADLTVNITEAEAAHRQEVDKLTDQINSLKDQTCEQPVAKKLTVSDHLRALIAELVSWFNAKKG